MTDDPSPSAPGAAAPPRPTLEDRVLRYIEGHNAQIWVGIAALAVVVVILR